MRRLSYQPENLLCPGRALNDIPVPVLVSS